MNSWQKKEEVIRYFFNFVPILKKDMDISENLINTLKENNQTLWEYALNQEMERSGRTREELREQMEQSLSVMERSAQKARREPVRSVSGLTGGNACLYEQYRQEGKSLLGEVASLAVGMALSCSEINASMQCIVACPTAGSCGIVPAAVLACAQSRGLDRECMVNALFTASAIGIIIGSRATVSGAEGGCQAECGAAEHQFQYQNHGGYLQPQAAGYHEKLRF